MSIPSSGQLSSLDLLKEFKGTVFPTVINSVLQYPSMDIDGSMFPGSIPSVPNMLELFGDSSVFAAGGLIGGETYRELDGVDSWWVSSGSQINVLDYGATANDGVTNAVPAINAAIQAAQLGQTVYFPQGTYLINQILGGEILLKTGVRLLGGGSNPSQVTLRIGSLHDLQLSIFTVSPVPVGSFAISNLCIENMTFDGADRDYSDPSTLRRGYLLTLLQIDNLQLISCEFKRNKFMAVALEGCRNVKIWGCKFEGNGLDYSLFRNNGVSSPALFIGGTLNAYGGCRDVVISRSVFNDNSWSAIYFFPINGRISDCVFSGNRESTVFANQSLKDAVIENNYIYNLGIGQRQNISASGLELSGVNLVVRNNFIRNCGADGISLQDASRVLIELNTLYDNSQEYIRAGYEATSGITINSVESGLGSSYITVRKNRSFNAPGNSTQRYGIAFFKNTDALAVSNSTISDNNFYSNVLGSIGNINNNSYDTNTVIFSNNISDSTNMEVGARITFFINRLIGVSSFFDKYRIRFNGPEPSPADFYIGAKIFRDDYDQNDLREWGYIDTILRSGLGYYDLYIKWFGQTIMQPGWAMRWNKDGFVPLNLYYRGGGIVPNVSQNNNIPTSGTIRYSDFRGASNSIFYSIDTAAYGLSVLTVPAGTWYVFAEAVGGGGGGGGGDNNSGAVLGSPGGNGASFRAKFTINAAQPGTILITAGSGGGPGGSDVNQTNQRDTPGYAGRGYTLLSASQPIGSGNVTTLANQFYRVGFVVPSWVNDLNLFAIWHPFFTTQGLNSRIPVSIFFPSSGNYRFAGAGDNFFRVYIDSTTNLQFSASNFNELILGTVSVTAGWHTLYFAALNTGGEFGIFLRINRQSDSLEIFSTNDLVSGGKFSGGFWFTNGGSGGRMGAYGQSGSGGGGGGSSAILWYPNGVDPRVSNGYDILAIAPGGGGGSGAGRGVNYTSAARFSANWQSRPVTTNANDIQNPSISTYQDTFNVNPAGSRVPYPRLITLHGHGHGNRMDFTPPYPDPLWTGSSAYTWDGGGGGGASAPWGVPGGYSEATGREWVYDGTAWVGPGESRGAGGSQGYTYFNSSYVNSYLASNSNTYLRGNGIGGLNTYNAAGKGNDGRVRLRISNIDDGIYPSNFTLLGFNSGFYRNDTEGPSDISLVFYTDGFWAVEGNSEGVLDSGSYIVAGATDNYWVRFTQLSVSPSTDGVSWTPGADIWEQLGTVERSVMVTADVSLGVNNPQFAGVNVQYLVEISTNSIGTAIVSSGIVLLSVYSTPII